MGTFIPNTPQEQQEMLESIGLSSFEDLYTGIPSELIIDELGIEAGKSQLEVEKILDTIADKNTKFTSIFRGAGAYNHYIPPMARKVPQKESFLTSYTPYQSEVSQGVLQNIFEFQTMMANLMGMDISNASMYDGASALAEAAGMCYDKKRKKTLIASSAHPRYKSVLKTYAHAFGAEVEEIPALENGQVDQDALKAALEDEKVASFIVQQPNYFGVIEDARALGELMADHKAKYIMSVNPLMMSVLASPGECQADIAVGEGQVLGIPLSFGGPYLGFLTCKQNMLRHMPGRVVGQTKDMDNKRSFVLTLQTREQHIRREKATSNICTNQALCALTASVYLASMGPEGLKEAAEQSLAHAAYLKSELLKIEGFEEVHDAPHGYEFVLNGPIDAHELETKLADKGILSGLPLEGKQMLWCATEMNSKEDIDELVTQVQEIMEGR
ncbi:MAG: aminomethyl-transferring glycine dehydrogenase subunit GcvPA [Coriobacteriia bacterium]|nr:aminomethyl-transferring glycine dehydrogenase subunit GcvPA [Coriobacteriia bacterium]